MPEIIPEQEAKRLILVTMAPHFPEKTKDYIFSMPYIDFLGLLETAIKDTHEKKAYWVTTLLYSDPNTELHRKLVSLQKRLAEAQIVPETNEAKRRFAPTLNPP